MIPCAELGGIYERIPGARAIRQMAGRRGLSSLGLHVCHANDYALTKRPGRPRDRIECHRDVLRIEQTTQL